MIKWTGTALLLGFFIDLLLGDPRWLYHPVRIIGNGISFFEKHLRNLFPKTEKAFNHNSQYGMYLIADIQNSKGYKTG